MTIKATPEALSVIIQRIENDLKSIANILYKDDGDVETRLGKLDRDMIEIKELIKGGLCDVKMDGGDDMKRYIDSLSSTRNIK